MSRAEPRTGDQSRAGFTDTQRIALLEVTWTPSRSDTTRSCSRVNWLIAHHLHARPRHLLRRRPAWRSHDDPPVRFIRRHWQAIVIATTGVLVTATCCIAIWTALNGAATNRILAGQSETDAAAECRSTYAAADRIASGNLDITKAGEIDLFARSLIGDVAPLSEQFDRALSAPPRNDRPVRRGQRHPVPHQRQLRPDREGGLVPCARRRARSDPGGSAMNDPTTAPHRRHRPAGTPRLAPAASLVASSTTRPRRPRRPVWRRGRSVAGVAFARSTNSSRATTPATGEVVRIFMLLVDECNYAGGIRRKISFTLLTGMRIRICLYA